MKGCHTIDRKSIVNIHVGHMHSFVFVYDIYRFVFIPASYSFVQFLNHRYQVRNYFLQILHRPFFQRFCQNCMVGIRTGSAYRINGLIHGKSSLFKQTNQFRNHHRRMCVINLNHYMFVKFMQIISLLLAFPQNQLCAAAYHKVLLINTQFTACIIRIIRVQKQGKIFTDFLFVKINTVLRNNTFIHRFHVKQMQSSTPGFISRNSNIIQYRFHFKVFKLHLKAFRLPHKPAFFCNPGILHLFLLMIPEFLPKQSEMVIQTNTVPRQPQGSNGIQKTGSQSSQSPVSKRGFLFQFFYIA